MTAVDFRPRAKKRWVAAAVLVLIAAYPAVEGPTKYAVPREWLARPWIETVFKPLQVVRHVPLLAPSKSNYVDWWERLGLGHNPPYAVSYRCGNKSVSVASEEYVVMVVPEGLCEVHIANRYRIAIEENRLLLGDWTTEFARLREVARIPAEPSEIAAKYFDDVLEIEVDGEPVEFGPSPSLLR